MDNDEVLRLLVRIGQADESAFRELYRAFSRKLYAYVLRQLGDTAQAEEIVSDTLYEVWKAPARFRGDSQFSTWLIGIARNKVLMAFRSRKPDAQARRPGCGGRDLRLRRPERVRHPGPAAAREGVRHCMDKLSNEHRECVHLVFYEGLALAEVASLQACPRTP